MVVVKQRPSLPICVLERFELFLECHCYPQVSHCKNMCEVLRFNTLDRSSTVLQKLQNILLVIMVLRNQNQMILAPQGKQVLLVHLRSFPSKNLPWWQSPAAIWLCFSVPRGLFSKHLQTIGRIGSHRLRTTALVPSWKRPRGTHSHILVAENLLRKHTALRSIFSSNRNSVTRVGLEVPVSLNSLAYISLEAQSDVWNCMEVQLRRSHALFKQANASRNNFCHLKVCYWTHEGSEMPLQHVLINRIEIDAKVF